jgi:predicted GNAT family acetyltransferase
MADSSPQAIQTSKGLIHVWNIFNRKPLPLQKVTTGRFEIEESGQVAYLEYSLAANILELIHTEVPQPLRHLGLASTLAETALEWAREHNLKVDLVCPTVRRYMKEHPEYSDLELR